MITTKLIKADDLEGIREAAEALRNGELVAFPTETVYGLGADARNVAAVRSIYAAKGRPSDNPLIVHISAREQLYTYSTEVCPAAEALAEAYMPGPMTLILPKTGDIPSVTSGGLGTVGLRFPSNPTARLLLELAGVPVAAPSANLSGKPSPTTAKHVMDDMNGRIPYIIDGGSCSVGVESTVIDFPEGKARILRPGGITAEMIERVTGSVSVAEAVLHNVDLGKTAPPSPGMKYKHYSPNANVCVYTGEAEAIASTVNGLCRELRSIGKRSAIICCSETQQLYTEADVIRCTGSQSNHDDAARLLFAILREMDDLHIDEVMAEALPTDGEGLAFMNRLLRAAGFKIVHCSL